MHGQFHEAESNLQCASDAEPAAQYCEGACHSIEDANASHVHDLDNIQDIEAGHIHNIAMDCAKSSNMGSNSATESYNPIPPPLPFDSHEDHFDPDRQLQNTTATNVLPLVIPASSSDRRDGVKKRARSHGVLSSAPKSPSVENATVSAPYDNTSSIARIVAPDVPSSIASSNCLQPISTQLTGTGRYTGSFNSAGQFHGHGSFEWIGESPWSGDVYQGSWVDGEKSGHGVYTSADGTIYDGFWLRNKKNGHGCTTYNSDGRSLLSDFTWCAGDSYDGEFVDNARHGTSVYTWFNGEKLRCVWDKGKCHEWSKKNASILNMFMMSSAYLDLVGQSNLLPKLRQAGLDDGSLVFCTTIEPLLVIGFDSKTATGLINCMPKVQYVHLDLLPSGDDYKGEIFRGVFHGKGTLKYKEGDCYYGDWRNGQRDGFGVMKYSASGSDSFGNSWNSGDKYEGEFKRDIRHGSCVYTWASGETLKCTWIDGFCHEWTQMNSAINHHDAAMLAKTQVSDMLQNLRSLFPISNTSPKVCSTDSGNSTMSSLCRPMGQISSLSEAQDGRVGIESQNRLLIAVKDSLQQNLQNGTNNTLADIQNDCFATTETLLPGYITNKQFAHALGVAEKYFYQLKKKGMPVHSVEAAIQWRKTRIAQQGNISNDLISPMDCQALNLTDTKPISGPTSISEDSVDSKHHVDFHHESHLAHSDSSRQKKFVVLSDGTVYDGECNLQGQFHGKGKLKFACGDTYVGEFFEGSKNGNGTYVYANQSFYNGLWKNGIKHGRGVSVYKTNGSVEKYSWSAGDIFDGEFVDNTRHGPCEYTWFNGSKLRCVWENGMCPEWSRMNEDILASWHRSKSPEPSTAPELSNVDVRSMDSSSESSSSPPPARRPPGIYNRSPPSSAKRSSATPPPRQSISKIRGLDKNGW
jgi:hypothetical protein